MTQIREESEGRGGEGKGVMGGRGGREGSGSGEGRGGWTIDESRGGGREAVCSRGVSILSSQSEQPSS
jgi:hypothetical protein